MLHSGVIRPRLITFVRWNWVMSYYVYRICFEVSPIYAQVLGSGVIMISWEDDLPRRCNQASNLSFFFQVCITSDIIVVDDDSGQAFNTSLTAFHFGKDDNNNNKKKKVSVLLVIQLKEEATHPKMVNEVGTSCAWSAEKKHELTEPLVRRQRSNSYPPGLCRPFRTNEQVIAKDPAENGNFKSQPSLACCRKRPPFPFPSTPPFFAFFLLSPTAVLTFQNSL